MLRKRGTGLDSEHPEPHPQLECPSLRAVTPVHGAPDPRRSHIAIRVVTTSLQSVSLFGFCTPLTRCPTSGEVKQRSAAVDLYNSIFTRTTSSLAARRSSNRRRSPASGARCTGNSRRQSSHRRDTSLPRSVTRRCVWRWLHHHRPRFTDTPSASASRVLVPS